MKGGQRGGAQINSFLPNMTSLLVSSSRRHFGQIPKLRQFHALTTGLASSSRSYSLDANVRNGILGGDDFLKTGIPDSQYKLTKLANEQTFELPLKRLLASHTHVDPSHVVEQDLRTVGASLKELVGSDHPVLHATAQHFFDVAGKRIRPTLVLLMARALSVGRKGDSSSSSSLASSPSSSKQEMLLPTQRRLSEITEMIHTASLLHDDVIDEADTRRGKPSVNAKYGNKLAILGGDFMLARASVALAHLRHPEVIILISTVIEHLVKGEVMQMKSATQSGLKETIDYYLTKSFYKTASLIANSCKSVALLGGHDAELQQIAYDYGTHLGLAFQVVDDLLDLQQTAEMLGKPAGHDMTCGVATAPVLYAADEYPHLKPLIESKFRGPNDVQTAIECIFNSRALERSRELAWYHAQQAAAAASELRPSRAQSALFALIHQVLNRTK